MVLFIQFIKRTMYSMRIVVGMHMPLMSLNSNRIAGIRCYFGFCVSCWMHNGQIWIEKCRNNLGSRACYGYTVCDGNNDFMERYRLNTKTLSAGIGDVYHVILFNLTYL